MQLWRPPVEKRLSVTSRILWPQETIFWPPAAKVRLCLATWSEMVTNRPFINISVIISDHMVNEDRLLRPEAAIVPCGRRPQDS